MYSSLQIDALAQGCCHCGRTLEDRDRIRVIYPTKELRGYANQVYLGIFGAGVRNLWAHLVCEDPSLRKDAWNMNPDLQHCIRCGESLDAKDMVSPVFQIVDPRAVNPDDPEDVGVSLGDRIYMIHASCHDPEFTKRSPILVQP